MDTYGHIVKLAPCWSSIISLPFFGTDTSKMQTFRQFQRRLFLRMLTVQLGLHKINLLPSTGLQKRTGEFNITDIYINIREILIRDSSDI